ncbi:pyrroloquinoline quinone precursor peptide PqqA [Alcanivorax xiamenensis]
MCQRQRPGSAISGGPPRRAPTIGTAMLTCLGRDLWTGTFSTKVAVIRFPGQCSNESADHGQSLTRITIEELAMWTKPSYVDMRIGFEVTMYISNR